MTLWKTKGSIYGYMPYLNSTQISTTQWGFDYKW